MVQLTTPLPETPRIVDASTAIAAARWPMFIPETFPPPPRPPRRMPSADHPLEVLDQRHTELLAQLDELDRQVEAVLAEYLPPRPTDSAS